MDCQKCSSEQMRDWSYYSGWSIGYTKTPHFYCHRCGAHYHNGTWYTKEEWFFFINEEMKNVDKTSSPAS